MQARRSDAGDTLVELLVTLTIVSLAVVALIGSLLTSTSSSITHRGVANLDGLLRSFAETARYQIEIQPQDGTSGPLFRPCAPANGYTLVSDPYPAEAPPGTPIAVFATGFPQGDSLEVFVGSQQIVPSSGGIANGKAIVFPAPSTTGAVKVVDALTPSISAVSKTPFTSGGTAAGISGATFSQYSLTSSVTSTCPVQQQQVTLTMYDPQSGSQAIDQIQFVVGNFAPQPVVVSETATSSYVPTTVTFRASVTDMNGTQEHSGQVTWTITGPTTPTCPVSDLSTGPATCVISLGVGQQGAYQVKALYQNGTVYPSGQTGVSTANVAGGVPQSVTVTADGSTGPLIFTATVTGSLALGWPGTGTTSTSVTWEIGANDGSSPACDSQSGPAGSGTTATYTCQLNTPTPELTYTAFANYGGNGSYANAFGSETIVLPQVKVSATTNALNQVTFTASLAVTSGSPTGKIAWTISPLPPLPSCTTASTYSGSPVTCQFTGAPTTTYTGTAVYTPDATSSTTFSSAQGKASAST